MFDPNTFVAIIGIISAVGGAGAGYGVTRTKIARAERDILKLAEKHDVHSAEDITLHTAIVQRLARMEATLDNIAKRIP